MQNTMRPIAVCAVSAAVIAAAVAAVIISGKRSETARRMLAAAEAREEASRAAAKAAASEEAVAAANLAAEEARLKTAEETRVAAETETNRLVLAIEEEQSRIDRTRLEKELADLVAEAKLYESDAIATTAEVERAITERQQAAAEQAAAEAAAEASKTERERVIAERVQSELKLAEERRIEVEEWAQQLADLQKELAEREALLKPEKTVADLVWLGLEEQSGTNAQSRAVLPEDDPTLPPQTRELAKRERLTSASHADRKAEVNRLLREKLEELRRKAIEDDRIVDANFFERALKDL